MFTCFICLNGGPSNLGFYCLWNVDELLHATSTYKISSVQNLEISLDIETDFCLLMDG